MNTYFSYYTFYNIRMSKFIVAFLKKMCLDSFILDIFWYCIL